MSFLSNQFLIATELANEILILEHKLGNDADLGAAVRKLIHDYNQPKENYHYELDVIS